MKGLFSMLFGSSRGSDTATAQPCTDPEIERYLDQQGNLIARLEEIERKRGGGSNGVSRPTGR
jgi:hypothetical protein